MAPMTLNITNADLLERLRNSFIDPNQKKQLEPLITEMTDEERAELVDLIQRSHEEKVNAEKERADNLEKLNAEYSEKLKQADTQFRGNLERIDKGEQEAALKSFESEISAVASTTRSAAAIQLTPEKKKHAIRQFILIFILLFAVAGGILYAITQLF